MEYFQSISDLIAGLENLEQEAWIHTDIGIWLSNPLKADFYYLPWDYMQSLDDDEVFVNDDGLELPLVLKDKNLREWMLVSVLAHIADSVHRKGEDVGEFIEQVNHYREFDTFKR
ncbi:hypothetical protein RugamoR57_49920 [Duganella caerulea]|uniref:hypothetical protein n=1 Tax=Duganella caerulea TaxID=2885762 RepID=UPI0030EAAB01